MNRGPITVRYAKALFELGKEKEILDKLYGDSKLLLDHFLEVKEFAMFLNSKAIKPSKKKETLQKVLKQEQHPYMLQFIYTVINNKREAYLKDMILHFEKLYKKDKGIKSVRLVTAVDFNKEYVKNLHIFLERELNAPVEIEAVTNPEILGGLILIIDGKIIDNSIVHQLKLIKKKLLS